MKLYLAILFGIIALTVSCGTQDWWQIYQGPGASPPATSEPAPSCSATVYGGQGPFPPNGSSYTQCPGPTHDAAGSQCFLCVFCDNNGVCGTPGGAPAVTLNPTPASGCFQVLYLQPSNTPVNGLCTNDCAADCS